MYCIYAYIYHKNQPNVGKYIIHGCYGDGCAHWPLPWRWVFPSPRDTRKWQRFSKRTEYTCKTDLRNFNFDDGGDGDSWEWCGHVFPQKVLSFACWDRPGCPMALVHSFLSISYVYHQWQHFRRTLDGGVNGIGTLWKIVIRVDRLARSGTVHSE